MNRVTNAIANEKINIANTQAIVGDASKALDLDFLEHAEFQQIADYSTSYALASGSGKLTLDEATSLYQLLGSTPSTFNSQPFEVKSVLTKIFVELADEVASCRSFHRRSRRGEFGWTLLLSQD